MKRKVQQDVPRLPMGVSFTVAGDPSVRAATRRSGLVRTAAVGFGVLIIFGGALGLTKLLAGSQNFAYSAVSPAQSSESRDTVMLVVAVQRLEKGSKIGGPALKEARWPRDQVPEGAVRSIDEAANMYASAAIPANQPILRSAISAAAPLSGIQDLLPAGHRAISIPVNSTTGIEGWATAGAHVDVLLTYLDADDGISKTRVVVENAIVLSYGGSAKASDDMESRGPGTMNLTTATLAVPFADSLKVTTALEMGRISLALRNASDVMTAGQGVFSSDEWDKKRPVAAPARPASSAKGYARVTGQDGKDKQWVLSDENRWTDNESEEFF